MIVDSHMHLWGDEVAGTDWLASPRTASIRRPFTLADYSAAAAGTDIGSAIVVTAERSARETARLLDECRGSALIAGVVGWFDLTDPRAYDVADQLLGIRLPAAGLDVHPGFARTGLVLELLVSARDLPAVARCADTLPGTTIVVDHLGDPPADGWEAWRRDVRDLASRANVRLKFSGEGATPRTLDVVLTAFGTGRLMFGSDWPVSSLRVPLGEEVDERRKLVASLSDDERTQLFATTALASYGLAG